MREIRPIISIPILIATCALGAAAGYKGTYDRAHLDERLSRMPEVTLPLHWDESNVDRPGESVSHEEEFHGRGKAHVQWTERWEIDPNKNVPYTKTVEKERPNVWFEGEALVNLTKMSAMERGAGGMFVGLCVGFLGLFAHSYFPTSLFSRSRQPSPVK